MCGRYTIGLEAHDFPEELARYYGVEPGRTALYPNFNAAPRQILPLVILGDDGRRRLVLMRWGLIPRWERDAEHGRFRPINARADRFRTLPTFRHLVGRQRALVAATGFLEWNRRHDGKQPFLFRPKDRPIFSLAGLWDEWRGKGPNAAEPRYSFTILTTDPNSLVEPLHDRMPVMLRREDEAAWLDPETDPTHVDRLTRPYAPEAMVRYPVSPRINLARNNAPELLQPIAEGSA